MSTGTGSVTSKPMMRYSLLTQNKDMLQILQGQVIVLFAFDVGYEVSLEQVSSLLSSMPVQPLSGRKRTPNYFQYTRPPQVLNWGKTDILNGFFDQPGEIQVKVFDFGAVSIAYRWPLTAYKQELQIQDLPQLSQKLYNQSLEADAKNQIQILTDKIQPAVVRPDLSPLVEDYYVFIIETLSQPLQTADLLIEHHSTLAQVLRFDTQCLSQEQQAEALGQSISYYENDLVFVDWNATIIFDQDYWDTLNVLEVLNVELLEARYIDAQLDRQIKEYEGLVQKRIEWPIPLRMPYRQAIEALAELRIGSSLLAERVENALKLIGDVYLARVHSAATQRFYLQEWESSISRKLDIIDNLYQVLTDRVGTAQSQTLELIIIALILIEIIQDLRS